MEGLGALLRSLRTSIALLLLVIGCAGARTVVVTRQHAYDPGEYAPYTSQGRAVVVGDAAVKTRLGHEIPASEDTVYLFPATRYAEEWWKRSLIEGRYFSDTDPRSYAFVHSTEADKGGHFRFGNLPAGEYYIVCAVTWSESQPGATWNWDLYSTVPPRHVVNVGTRIRLTARDTLHVVLERVSETQVLIAPPPSVPK